MSYSKVLNLILTIFSPKHMTLNKKSFLSYIEISIKLSFFHLIIIKNNLLIHRIMKYIKTYALRYFFYKISKMLL